MEVLVTPEWVNERLRQPGFKVVDASWFMPNQGRNGKAEFLAQRIPGSVFFDIDQVADLSINLPHMLPSEKQFSAAMDAIGISNSSSVVVYDRAGIFSAPRAWWMFKAYGHDKVVVLDGGFPAWQAGGFEVESSPLGEEAVSLAAQAAKQPPATTQYQAKLDKSKVRSLSEMVANVGSRAEQVMDARSYGRFVASEPEPRAGLRGGHIPGSKSLPIGQVLEPAGSGATKFKGAEQLAAAYKAAGIDVSAPLVGSCGSGVTASLLALGVYALTGKLVPIYDGSWSEWGSRQDTPIATDPSQ